MPSFAANHSAASVDVYIDSSVQRPLDQRLLNPVAAFDDADNEMEETNTDNRNTATPVVQSTDGPGLESPLPASHSLPSTRNIAKSDHQGKKQVFKRIMQSMGRLYCSLRPLINLNDL